ncbi:MAG: serine protease [Brevundimonas sp.]|nr:serine protease [Brevundimonas sp.]
MFMTARHVVDGAAIREVRLTNAHLFYRSSLYPKGPGGSYRITSESPRMTDDYDGVLRLVGQPNFHPDPTVDLAALRVTGMSQNAHFVPLGGHLDDSVGEGDFELSRAVVLGYPPIPFTRQPVLIAASCEVNATVDLAMGSNQLHFLLSAVPRGGFSGGLAFSEWGFALGVITQSLISGGGPPETGYFTATSIEAVYVCLQANGLLPKAQSDGWDGLWDDKDEGNQL